MDANEFLNRKGLIYTRELININDERINLIELLNEYKALSQHDVMCWVACSERLPDSIGSYLCFWENCYVGMLFFNSNQEWCEMWQQEKHKPTHWMPLPKPPCT